MRTGLLLTGAAAAVLAACTLPATTISNTTMLETGNASDAGNAADAGDAGTMGSSTCADREALLAANRAAFDGRRDSVQAELTGGITKENWAAFPSSDTWGPHAAAMGPLAVAGAACADRADRAAGERELLLAVENYWVEQGINYCHHHIPGWLPPDTGGYRNSTAGSTSGAGHDPMTCTANRFADGHQRVASATGSATCSAPSPAPYCDSSDEIASSDPSKQVQWHGVDCSDFTAWAYDFAGLTASPLPTAIATQACDTTVAGALFDISGAAPADLERMLKPGDLVYVRAKNAANVSHVVTWTGLHWRDLAKSSAAASFDPARLGAPGSRLGGDLLTYASLADLERDDPPMILDSHYAGPAYRPFVGWYRESASHVRRVIDAADTANDPALANALLRPEPGRAPLERTVDGKTVSYTVLVAPAFDGTPDGTGHRLLYAGAASATSCARDH